MKLTPVEGGGANAPLPSLSLRTGVVTPSISLSTPPPPSTGSQGLSGLLTPSKPLEVPRAQAKKDWLDAFGEIVDKPSYYMPYLNISELYDSAQVYRAVSAYERGEATPQQIAVMDKFSEGLGREGTFGYKFVNTVARLPAYAIEFVTAGAVIKGAAKGAIAKGTTASTKAAIKRVAGLKGLEHLAAESSIRVLPKVVAETSGVQALNRFFAKDTLGTLARSKARWLGARAAVHAAEEGADVAALKAAEEKAWDITIGRVRQHLVKSAAEAAGPRNLMMAHRIANQTVTNMTPIYGLSEDEAGELHRVLLDEGDNFWSAFGKAYGDMAIENFSEQTAEAFFAMRKLWGPDAEQFLKAAVLDRGARRLAEATGVSHNEALKGFLRTHFMGKQGAPGTLERMGWYGVLPELGEEAVGGALRQATGISPLGLPDMEDVAVMALAFAVNPLAMGNYAADEIHKQTDARYRQTIKGFDLLKNNMYEGIITKDLSDPAVEAAADYIRFALDKPETWWGKLKQSFFGTRGQRLTRQLWLEHTRADLDQMVVRYQALMQEGQDPAAAVDEEDLRRWVIAVNGGQNWVEDEADFNTLTDIGLVTLTPEERQARGLQFAAVTLKPRDTWTEQELEVMDKYHWLFELQDISNPQSGQTVLFSPDSMQEEWEDMTPEDQRDMSYALTGGTYASQRLEATKRQYKMLQGVMRQTQGEIEFVRSRKIGLIGTRAEFAEQDVILPPDARPLPRPVVQQMAEGRGEDIDVEAEDFEDVYMGFLGGRVDVVNKRVLIEPNISPSSLAQELVHIWSVGPGGRALTPIVAWGAELTATLSNAIANAQVELAAENITEQDRTRIGRTAQAATELLQQIQNEDGTLNPGMIGEVWTKLFAMERLGMAKRVVTDKGERVIIAGEADRLDGWLLELELELPEWADGIVNVSSRRAGPTLSSLARPEAPYDPTATAYLDPDTGEMVVGREPGTTVRDTASPEGVTPRTRAVGTVRAGMDEAGNLVDEDEEPPPPAAAPTEAPPPPKPPPKGSGSLGGYGIRQTASTQREGPKRKKQPKRRKEVSKSAQERAKRGRQRRKSRPGVTIEAVEAPTPAPAGEKAVQREIAGMRILDPSPEKLDQQIRAIINVSYNNPPGQTLSSMTTAVGDLAEKEDVTLKEIEDAVFNSGEQPDSADAMYGGYLARARMNVLEQATARGTYMSLEVDEDDAVRKAAIARGDVALEQVPKKYLNENGELTDEKKQELQDEAFAFLMDPLLLAKKEFYKAAVGHADLKLTGEKAAQVEAFFAPTQEEIPPSEEVPPEASTEAEEMEELFEQLEAQRWLDDGGNLGEVEAIAAARDGDMTDWTDQDQLPVAEDGAGWQDTVLTQLAQPAIQEIIHAINPVGSAGEETLWEKSHNDPDFIEAVQSAEAWAAYLADPDAEDTWFREAFLDENGNPKFDHYWIRGIQRLFASLHKPQALQMEIERELIDPKDPRKGMRERKLIIRANIANRAKEWTQHIVQRAEALFGTEARLDASRREWFHQMGRIGEEVDDEGNRVEVFDFSDRPRETPFLNLQGELEPLSPEQMADALEFITGIDRGVFLRIHDADKSFLPEVVNAVNYQLIRPTWSHFEVMSKVIDVFTRQQSYGRKRTTIRSNVQRMMDVQTEEDFIAARYRGADGEMQTSYVRESDLLTAISNDPLFAGLQANEVPIALWSGRRIKGQTTGRKGVDGKDEVWGELQDDFFELYVMPEVDWQWDEVRQKWNRTEFVPDYYWQPIGQLGGKMRPVVVLAQRYTIQEARERIEMMLYDIDEETGERTLSPEGQFMIEGRFVMPLELIERRAREWAKEWHPEDLDLAEEYYWNYAANAVYFQTIAFGQPSEYKNLKERNKRASSSWSDGIKVDLYPDGKDGVGPTINVVYLDDGPDKFLDGIVLNTGEFTTRVQNGMAAPQLPRHLGPNTWRDYRLHASKMLYSGRAAGNPYARRLNKANFLDLQTLAELMPNSVYAELQAWVNRYNEGKPWEEQIHQIVPTSSGKVRPRDAESKDIPNAFTQAGPNRYQLSARDALPEDLEALDANGLVVQNPLVNTVTPKTRNLPTQVSHIWLDLPHSVQITELRNQALALRGSEVGEKVNVRRYLDREKNSDLWSYLDAMEPWNPLIAARIQAVVAARLEKQVLRDRVRKVLLQEIPSAGAADLTDFVPVMQNEDGRWVEASASDATRVRLPRVRTGIQERDLRPVMLTNIKRLEDVVRFILDNRSRYADLIEVDDEGNLTNEVKTWELERDEEGDWIIPGALIALVRVPADDHHSVIFARQGEILEGKVDLVGLHKRVQEIGGSDNDGDQRHALLLYQDAQGFYSINEHEPQSRDEELEQLYNHTLLLAAKDYETADVWQRTQRPIDTKAYQPFADKYDVDNPYNYANTLDGHQAAWSEHRVGEDLIGIFARANVTYMALRKMGFHLKKRRTGKDWRLRIQGADYDIVVERPAGKTMDPENVISAHLGNLLNMALDNASDPQLQALGINQHTAGMVFALLITNPDLRTYEDFTNYMGQIAAFLNSQEVKAYVRQSNRVSQLADRGGATQKALWDDVQKSLLTSKATLTDAEQAEEQAIMARIRQLKQLSDLADELQEIGQVMKHTAVIPKTLEALHELEQKVSKVRSNGYEILDTTSLNVGGKLHPVLRGLDASMELAGKVYAGDIMRTLVADRVIEDMQNGTDWLGNPQPKDLTREDLTRIRRALAEAFLVQSVMPEYYEEGEAARLESLLRGPTQITKDRRMMLTWLHGEIKRDLGRQRKTPDGNIRGGKTNAFLELFVDAVAEDGTPTIEVMQIMRRGQVEKDQLEQIHRDFNNLATYWEKKKLKVTREVEENGKIVIVKDEMEISGRELQILYVTEAILSHGPSMSASTGSWLPFVSDQFWKSLRESFELTYAKWSNGGYAAETVGAVLTNIKREVQGRNMRTPDGIYDELTDEEYDAWSITMVSNWGRMNPMTRLIGGAELHSFIVDVRNWSRSEYHRSIKIVDQLQVMAGAGKLIGHAAVPHQDDDGYDIVDLNRAHRMEVDEEGNPIFQDDHGQWVDAIVDTAPSERQAWKRVRELDKELKERQPDKARQAFAADVLSLVTAMIERSTSNYLSADHELYTLSGKRTQIVNGRSREVPDYVILKGVKRNPPNEDGEITLQRETFKRVSRDRNGNPVRNQEDDGYVTEDVVKPNGASYQVFAVDVVSGAEIMDLVGRDDMARLIRLARYALHSRTRLNEKMAQLLGTEDWIAWRNRYVPHRFAKRAERFTEAEQREAKEIASRLWARRLETGRTEERTFPDFLTAAMIRGLEPVSMRIDELIRLWYGEVVKTAANRMIVAYGMVTKDMDGSPLWMPIFDPNKEVLEWDLMKPIGRRILFEALQGATDYFNHRARLRGKENDFVVNMSANPKAEWMRFYAHFKDADFRAAGFHKPFKDGSNFKNSGLVDWWVRKATDHPGPYSNAAENLIKMIEQPAHREWKVFGRDWFIGIRRFNEWSKTSGLSFSLFHPFALLESFVALGGLTVSNFSLLMRPFRTYARVRNLYRQEKAWGHLTEKWLPSGLIVDTTNPNFLKDVNFQEHNQASQTLVQKDLDAIIEKGWPVIAQGAAMYKKYLHWVDKWLWSEMFPALKLYMAETVEYEMRRNYEMRNLPYDGDELKRSIGRMMNHALGGQNWHEYIWMTPERLQLLHLMLFAPDWTLSAFNIAQAGQVPILRDHLRVPTSEAEREWAWKKYWPAMAIIVMTGIPQAIQLAIYMAFGDPDEDDTPWITDNEPEKSGALGIRGLGGHVDITPMVRHLGWVPIFGYEGEPTGRRRVYLRWAKQATEVFEGWLTKPMQTLFSKSSPAVRTAYEQITGTNTAGWELAFKGEGLSGFFGSAETGTWQSILNSRAGYVGKKFAPMSMVGVVEGRPSAFFAPASRGVTLYTATTQLAGVLESYANERVYLEMEKDPRRVKNLAALGPEILRAAWKNGIDPEEVVTRAKSHVLGKLYGDFFLAIQKEDQKKMEQLAIAINRVHGTIGGLIASMEKRTTQIRKFWSEEDEAKLMEWIHGRIER